MKKQFLIIISLLILSTACVSQKKVDLIVKNAKVYTVDGDFKIVEAFAIHKGKFVAVGSTDVVCSSYTAKKTIDLEGQYVYPGFIDAHAHFYGYGIGKQSEAPLYETISDKEVVQALIDFQAEKQNDWIIGRGWDQNDWESKSFPNKKILDQSFPSNPVYLTRVDGHAAWVNSKALELAGINSDTHVDGGEIILLDNEPSGILIDNAMGLVRSIIPKPKLEANIKSLKIAEKDCFAAGLTSVSDAGLQFSIVQLIDSLNKSNDMDIRINAILDPSEENLLYYLPKGPYVTDQLSVRSFKLYADGALGSRGACLKEPYTDKHEHYGMMLNAEAYFKKMCKLALNSDFQVVTHAIGDSANRVVLKIYGEALKSTNDRRWRIEHAQVVGKEDFDLFKKYSIIPSVQPTHATSDMYWADDRLGHKRLKGAYAYKQLLDQLGWIPLGTDFPVEKIDPILTFYASTVRKDLNAFPSEGFQMENALSRVESLKGMTIWAAKAAFEEDKKGSIEVGKFADFTVLNQDIMECAEDEIPKTKIRYTVVGGKIVYEKAQK